ncbi:Wzb Protein-tyrosine-phosphatase [Candidatus Nanopelagicaceae bacterium]
MAAAVLANRAGEVQTPQIIVTSSGTSSWHIGEDAHELSKKTWTLAGYTHSHSARQFVSERFDEVDLILAMDLSNHANILKLARNEEDRAKVAMFRSFDPEADSVEVPDPWGNEIEAYQEVLSMVEAAVSGLLKTLR